MKNLIFTLIAVAAIAMTASSETEAQMYGFGTFGGVNGYNGNHINYYGGCGVAADPRLGYCLENDCFCSGNNGCFGGYSGNGNGCGGCGNGYGGCGNGCNNSRGMVIRITTRRGDAEPEVKVIYPQSNGCGCGTGNPSMAPAKATASTMPRSNRYTAAHRIPRATASAKRPSGSTQGQTAGNTAPAKKVKYRYRY